MARSSSSSGTYRGWEAQQRAEQKAREQAARQKEQQRKARERARILAEGVARDQDAARRTSAVERRIAELGGLLRLSLARDPRVDISSLRRRLILPALELGELAVPLAPPEWTAFAPAPPRGLGRMFGGSQRYEAASAAAESAFLRAQEDHRRREAERQARLVEAQNAHRQECAKTEHDVATHNAHIEELALGLTARDRYAVSEYVQMVLDRSPYPRGFPSERNAGYVPESSLLAVEWYLPPVEVVPTEKVFRHVKARKMVEPTARPLTEIRQTYQSVIAQIALRTLREVFDSTSGELISTVVFNGRVRAIDPLTGQKIQPHLITLRATREQFAPLVLTEPKFNPVECVRKYFFADISPHPDELIPVEPVMPYSMADPRVIEPIDIISEIDKRPNLLELSPKEFEAFIQNLFAKMGFDTKLYRASGDGGTDCIAYDPHPITGGKFIVQAKLYNRTVQPTHVRDLWGTVQHEGATKGIMITTSGYGPDSYKFAGGKPLNLIDGSGLLALCRDHGVPARILGRGRPGGPRTT
jgi:restriction system protein